MQRCNFRHHNLFTISSFVQLFQKQGLKGYCHMFVDFWVKFRPKLPRRWPSPRIAMLSRTFLPSLPRTPMANGVHDFTLLHSALKFAWFFLGLCISHPCLLRPLRPWHPGCLTVSGSDLSMDCPAWQQHCKVKGQCGQSTQQIWLVNTCDRFWSKENEKQHEENSSLYW